MSPAPLALRCLLLVTTTTTLLLSPTAHGKRVVTLPIPAVSHVQQYAKVARILAQRGHQVSVAVPTYMLDQGLLDTSAFTVIPCEIMPGLEEKFRNLLSGSYFEKKAPDMYEVYRLSRHVIDSLLRNDSLLRTIQRQSPDLIVIDNYPNFYSLSIIPYRLGVPFAFLGSYYDCLMLRVPFSFAEVALNILPYSNRMTFLQRLRNTFFHILFSMNNPSCYVDDVSTYAPEMKYLPLDELVRQAEVFLVELDHVMDYPKPTVPNVKLIGGTSTGPAKALGREFQSFMDSAKEGVVIVSLGSSVLQIPEHISDKIFQVLLELPMKSVFRSNLPSPDPKKILTAPWIPQNDLLGHPHTKVFVSHCGKNGQYEALYHAVPIVATPLFIDQPYNAERVRMKGFAEVLDLNSCAAEEMKSAILTVANEPKYRQAVEKYSRLYKELYTSPLESAAFWLEHVMEHGGDYMRSSGQQMPLYQFVLLDVILFIGCVLTLMAGLLCLLVKAICARCCNRKDKKE